MYSRKLNGKVLEFGHEGVLYRRSFVMYDRGTDSLWVHTTGECVKGEMKGSQLEFITSSITSWGNWVAKHPKSLVLEGEGRGGFMGTYTLAKDKADDFGVSVGQGETAKLYLMKDLMKNRVVHDKFQNENVVVFFDEAGMHATAWACDDQKFSFKGNAFVDSLGRPWDMMLGRPVGDMANDEKMKPLPATAWLIKRWHGFYPNSEVWKAAKSKDL
ncbi:MAG: hypothetical protein ACI97A_002997 [Planctomycetota bacterium]